MTMKDDVRDVIGEAIQDGIDHDTFWPEVGADAALAALAEHGYVVVPRADIERVEAALGVARAMARADPWRAALALVRRWQDGPDA